MAMGFLTASPLQVVGASASSLSTKYMRPRYSFDLPSASSLSRLESLTISSVASAASSPSAMAFLRSSMAVSALAAVSNLARSAPARAVAVVLASFRAATFLLSSLWNASSSPANTLADCMRLEASGSPTLPAIFCQVVAEVCSSPATSSMVSRPSSRVSCTAAALPERSVIFSALFMQECMPNTELFTLPPHICVGEPSQVASQSELSLSMALK
mmetsp:Transcript_72903/g.157628  ORF Transcript_72903/g.157628 Transcript_72903/m.157628 type:complete len:215 (+) Transcript_72903:506-1150(+)